MLKAQKKDVVTKLGEELKSAQSAILVDYTGLNVTHQQELKKRLKEVGAKMIVVKNTLIRLAGKEAKVDEQALSDSVLSGQTAVVLSNSDPVSPIQVLGKFAKEFELPKFKVGIVEGNFQDTESLTKISKLPAREILLGQVMGSIASPLYGVVATLQGNLQKLVFVLDAKARSSS